MPFKAGHCAPHGLQKGTVRRVLGIMLGKTSDAPLGDLLRFGPSNPAQRFFDTVGIGGSEATLDGLQESVLLILRSYCLGAFQHGPTSVVGNFDCLASSFLTSSTALIKSWTTWNQPTVTEADLNFCSPASRKAGGHVAHDLDDVFRATFMGFNAKKVVRHSLPLAVLGLVNPWHPQFEELLVPVAVGLPCERLDFVFGSFHGTECCRRRQKLTCSPEQWRYIS